MSGESSHPQSAGRWLGWHSFVMVTLASIALCLVVHSDVRGALLNRYAGDSIYTLSMAAALGLMVICAVLLAIVLMLSWFGAMCWIKLSTNYSAFITIVFYLLNHLVTAAIYFLMLVIAPQIFYTYYQWIFTGLPVQWVVKPLSIEVLFKLVSLQPGESIADHLAGFMFWVLMFNTTIQWLLDQIYLTKTARIRG